MKGVCVSLSPLPERRIDACAALLFTTAAVGTKRRITEIELHLLPTVWVFRDAWRRIMISYLVHTKYLSVLYVIWGFFHFVVSIWWAGGAVCFFSCLPFFFCPHDEGGEHRELPLFVLFCTGYSIQLLLLCCIPVVGLQPFSLSGALLPLANYLHTLPYMARIFACFVSLFVPRCWCRILTFGGDVHARVGGGQARPSVFDSRCLQKATLAPRSLYIECIDGSRLQQLSVCVFRAVFVFEM